MSAHDPLRNERASLFDALRTELTYEDFRVEKGRPARAGIGIAPSVLRELLATVDRLWEVIGCAEAYFTAGSDDEHEQAEREFFALLNSARAE